MTPFYEGWVRARRVTDELTRPSIPIDEIIRPPIGYRLGRGLVHLGAHLMFRRSSRDEQYELAA
jgi:hypothetical protein